MDWDCRSCPRGRSTEDDEQDLRPKLDRGSEDDGQDLKTDDDERDLRAELDHDTEGSNNLLQEIHTLQSSQVLDEESKFVENLGY